MVWGCGRIGAVGGTKTAFGLEELQRGGGGLIARHRLHHPRREAIGVAATGISATFRQLTEISFDEIFDGGSLHRVITRAAAAAGSVGRGGRGGA